ncbi:CLUMA_CG007640, isoform A [Clunio marinus]|uniref:CLUMA_CG007640, isoform A n=1 Tax=Clunio marinus TaxID=568069 RepID=A0A1J1I1F8_9DIPT|nr:CLUMA_CG007640, isoform A [Clunio marinus]
MCFSEVRNRIEIANEEFHCMAFLIFPHICAIQRLMMGKLSNKVIKFEESSKESSLWVCADELRDKNEALRKLLVKLTQSTCVTRQLSTQLV